MEKKFKEFKPTSWAIDNKLSIYVLTVIIAIFGIVNYNSIPKEQFPEVVIPTIVVSTIYPGTAPSDMENLVTRPIEKNIKSISGVKKVTSKSIQDFSVIMVEFNTGIDVPEAKQKVKDAVDKTKKDLPNDLLQDPSVAEVDISDMPIMYVNIKGDYSLDKLKQYADVMQDRIESLKEITRVDIVGALDREIQINVDMYKMQAASLTFGDIERAVKYENMTIAGGSIAMDGMQRSVRVVGEFKDMETIRNIVVHSSSGASVYLKDVAHIDDTFKEQESYSRMDGKNVITLNIIKKSGQNLLDASDQIKDIITDLKKNKFPSDLDVAITNDQSKFTRTTLADLNNTIVIGFLLVTLVLMFFMGLTNAIFVGLSVPLSMALAYIAMPGIDFTMNMLVMFAFIFALGIVVDDAIVVVENTHRIFMKTRMPIAQSAKYAAGEVFMPILSGTLTTLAPFFPLAFWPGVVGQFMFYIPVTIIITLFASLIVAYIINPVFAVDFMSHDDETHLPSRKKIFKTFAFFVLGGLLLHLIKAPFLANVVIFIGVVYVFHNIWGARIIFKFQHKVLPRLMIRYENLLKWVLTGRRPYWLLYGLIGLFIFTMFMMGVVKPKVVFFPDNEPNQANVFIKLPVGTDVKISDSIARVVEKKVYHALGIDAERGMSNPLVESITTNVALGASESNFDGAQKTSNKAKITVNFVEFAARKGASTQPLMDTIRTVVKGVAGAQITVEKNRMGPPTGKPINIEISGENLEELVVTSGRFMRYLDSLNIGGIEKLKTDFDQTKPELILKMDRVRANIEGISTAQAGSEMRTAILGTEASKYRDGEDQYPIQLRYQKDQRENIDRLLNLKITYRDMNSGMLRQIPLSSVAKVEYVNSYGGINRKNMKRVITISSDVLTGYTANEIVMQINKAIPNFHKSEDVEIKLTGEQEDQAETGAFLGKAMLLALCLIMFILITQFNSISKPVIIISEILFSLIGVFAGYMITGMSISIIMTGMGVVALVGIVVRNGILLVEFTDVLKADGLKTRDAIITAGKTRITPVLLTAIACILGLIPLAIGFNIDFIGLFTSFEPHIHFGGDNVSFFGPLAWTIIFGLTIATFLTLVMIPAMYFIAYAGKAKASRTKSNIRSRREKKKQFI